MSKYTTSFSGYVYLIQEHFGLFKVGRTQNVQSRIQTLSGATPYPLKLISAIHVDDADTVERSVHRALAVYRVPHTNEWFNLPNADIGSSAIEKFRHEVRMAVIIQPRTYINGTRFKLTPQDVIEIRKIYKTQALPYIRIANMFGVSEQTIRGIVKRWTHQKVK